MIARLKLRMEGWAWLAGWRIVRALPEGFVMRMFERFGARSYRRNAHRRDIVRANLAPVVPPEELEQTVRDAFRWYSRYWAETFRMPDIPTAEFDARFDLKGREHIQAGVDAGTGVLLATLHQGNWDAGGRWVAARWGLAAVVEVLRPRVLFERFAAHRETLGIKVIPLERGGDPTGRCEQELRAGGVIALVADRDLSQSGVEVEMFGRRTKMPPGPAVLALRTGAPLIPATIYQREDGLWFAHVMPPLEKPTGEDAVAVLTQRLAKAYEQLIAAEPAQWHMFSRYWID